MTKGHTAEQAETRDRATRPPRWRRSRSPAAELGRGDRAPRDRVLAAARLQPRPRRGAGRVRDRGRRLPEPVRARGRVPGRHRRRRQARSPPRTSRPARARSSSRARRARRARDRRAAVGDAGGGRRRAATAATAAAAGRGRAPGRTGRLAADRREQPHGPARARGRRVALGLGRRSAPPRGADQPGRRVGAPRRGRQVARGDRRRARRAGRDAGGVDARPTRPASRARCWRATSTPTWRWWPTCWCGRTSRPPSWNARAARSIGQIDELRNDDRALAGRFFVAQPLRRSPLRPPARRDPGGAGGGAARRDQRALSPPLRAARTWCSPSRATSTPTRSPPRSSARSRACPPGRAAGAERAGAARAGPAQGLAHPAGRQARSAADAAAVRPPRRARHRSRLPAAHARAGGVRRPRDERDDDERGPPQARPRLRRLPDAGRAPRRRRRRPAGCSRAATRP